MECDLRTKCRWFCGGKHILRNRKNKKKKTFNTISTFELYTCTTVPITGEFHEVSLITVLSLALNIGYLWFVFFFLSQNDHLTHAYARVLLRTFGFSFSIFVLSLGGERIERSQKTFPI